MTTPMYRDIAEQLRERIESGEFVSGTQLPTEQDLQAQYSASRNTIREAIKQLITLGLVETKPGQGTFVVARPEPFVTALTGNPGTAVDYISGVLGKAGKATASGMQVEIQEASGDVAVYLKLAPGDEVISRHRKRYLDDAPWALETSFYPGQFADRGADSLRKVRDIGEGTVNYLKDKIGVRQAGYRDRVTGTVTERDRGRLLQTPPGRPSRGVRDVQDRVRRKRSADAAHRDRGPDGPEPVHHRCRDCAVA